MRDHSIVYKSAIEEYCQGTEKDLPLPSSHNNTGTAIHIDNPPAIQDGRASGDTAALIQSFAARLTKTEDTLTEMKTNLEGRLAETVETRAELLLVNTKVESLEAQIIALHGDRTYVAIRSLFDVADIPLDAARSLKHISAVFRSMCLS